MNKAKAKGTLAESAVVKYLAASIFPGAERRTLSGRYDKGDVNPHAPIVFEIKSVASPSLPALLRETETERINAEAEYGILVHKPAGIGVPRVHEWTALMPQASFENLVKQGESQNLIHVVPRSANSLDLRRAMKDAADLAVVINPAAPVSAILVATRGALENYYAVRLRDVVLLLARAGYGTSV